MESSSEVKFLAEASVTTLSGRQFEVQVVDVKTIATNVNPWALKPLGISAGTQHPIGPILVLESERAAEFHGVDSEPLENVLVDDCELLDRVVHAEWPAWKTEEFSKPDIRHSGNPGGAVARKVNGDSIRFSVVE